MKTWIVLSAAVFLFCALKAPPTAAVTLHVMPDGSGDAPSIQAGLDMCEAGDILLVAPGIYTENIIWPVTTSLKLMSESGPEMTVLDGDGAGSVIHIGSGVGLATEIRGFTIQNGDAYSGGGIHCDGGSSPTIKYNIITGNTATGGGGILYSSNSAPKIVGNTISHNSAVAGGGVLVWDDCGGEIRYNIITQNTASTGGGGGIASQNGFPIIADNEIKGNVGGAILCNLADQSTIIGNVITSNVGTGVTCSENASPNIQGCTIAENTGNGVYCPWDSYPLINFNNIFANGGHGVMKSGPVEVPVDALNNWWGDPSGPSYFGPGTGDGVTNFVDFDPWSVGAFNVSDAGPPTSPVPFVLSPNYPNPFNPNTTIPFSVDRPQRVKVSMYDLTGRRLAVLVDQVFGAGSHAAHWDGRDELGRAVSSGPYLVSMETGGRVESQKIMLVR